jgi:ABC-type nitrate/sulfonate/bicarbonate transport system substrate-binding protein
MLLIAKDDYLKHNAATVKAFLSDVVSATTLYNKDPKAARKTLIDTRQVRISPAVYLPMKDYYRDPDAKVDVGALEKMQDAQIQNGFQSKRVDLKSIVDMSYLPGAAQ